MPRSSRLVVPGYPHHVIQRGNRRQQTFFNDNDYRYYLDLLDEWCQAGKTSLWAYCLMPNHVHLVMVPETEDSLRLTVSQIHRRYTMMVNKREGWTGHLWQARFASYVMDEAYTLAAVRYIEMNPVASGIVGNPGDYRWSSAAAHLGLYHPDVRLAMSPLTDMIPCWAEFLGREVKPGIIEDIRKSESSGHPLGSKAFVDNLGTVTFSSKK
ncbi:MAG: transposase [Alphaproteobacteria bacterium]|nr:transposase [Alphaproteobacteria bacterium]